MKTYPPVERVALGSGDGTINGKTREERSESSMSTRETMVALFFLLAILTIPLGVGIKWGIGPAFISFGLMCGVFGFVLGLPAEQVKTTQVK